MAFGMSSPPGRPAIGELLPAVLRCRRLRALCQKPGYCPRGGNVTALPRPRVGVNPIHVAAKKSHHLVGAAEERFLGRDHYDIGIWRQKRITPFASRDANAWEKPSSTSSTAVSVFANLPS